MGLPVRLHKKDAQLLGGEQVFAAVKDFFENRRGIGDRTTDHPQYF